MWCWLQSDPYDSPLFVGNVATFKPIYQYGPPNATSASAAINQVPAGSMVYMYLGLGSDMAVIDQIAHLVNHDDVELVGHRKSCTKIYAFLMVDLIGVLQVN